MDHNQRQLYNTLIGIILILFIVMPVQIRAFWYGLRILSLLSIVIFLKYIARNMDDESKNVIRFKSYFWIEILIYIIYQQYFIPDSVYAGIILAGYMVVLIISFVYGRKIKGTDFSVFFAIECGLLGFIIFNIFL